MLRLYNKYWIEFDIKNINNSNVFSYVLLKTQDMRNSLILSSSTMESTIKLISKILLIFNLLNLKNGVLCDFTYGYETDDFTLAIINLTYTDPKTGVQHTEYEEYGKYSIGRIGSVSGRLGQSYSYSLILMIISKLIPEKLNKNKFLIN